MTKLYKTLLKQMGQKIAIYNELIELLAQEWDSVSGYSLLGVQETLNKKETLVLKMQVLEENRLEVVRAIANKLDVPYEGLTLKKIIALKSHPLNSKLSLYRKKLLKQIDLIAESTEKTKRIVDHSSMSIKKSLSFLHKTQEKSEAGYQAKGKIREGKMQSRMLSAEV
jgi:flagellar biosynthesis/type III secretory pathway chaperone